ncbi:hypothetical protein VP242E401_P0033 [Vibrio phage 242E40-1]|nr:hypothetical protein VP242E401_P0033 [Vibrio phage 242E40-1]
MRKDGYYWVLCPSQGWIIAEYSCQFKMWVEAGDDGSYSNEDYDEIDEEQIVKSYQ